MFHRFPNLAFVALDLYLWAMTPQAAPDPDDDEPEVGEHWFTPAGGGYVASD